jgi:hypothetical protein
MRTRKNFEILKNTDLKLLRELRKMDGKDREKQPGTFTKIFGLQST